MSTSFLLAAVVLAATALTGVLVWVSLFVYGVRRWSGFGGKVIAITAALMLLLLGVALGTILSADIYVHDIYFRTSL